MDWSKVNWELLGPAIIQGAAAVIQAVATIYLVWLTGRYVKLTADSVELNRTMAAVAVKPTIVVHPAGGMKGHNEVSWECLVKNVGHGPAISISVLDLPKGVTVAYCPKIIGPGEQDKIRLVTWKHWDALWEGPNVRQDIGARLSYRDLWGNEYSVPLTG